MLIQCCAVGLSVLLPLEVLAAALPVTNLSPLVTGHTPPPALGSALAPEDGYQLGLRSAWSNAFSSSGDATNGAFVDLETLTTTLSVRRRVSTRSEIGVAMSHVRHSGGVLDGFIDGYHGALGLPDGNRDATGSGNVDVRLVEAGQTVAGLADPGSGFGDVELHGGWSVYESNDRQVTARLALDLPTGDHRRLRGDGGVGAHAAVEWTERQLGTLPVAVHLRAGLSRYVATEVAASDRGWSTFGTFGFHWRVARRLTLSAQLDGQSARFESPFREAGDWAAIGTLGGSLRISERVRWHLGVAEDLRPGANPDVTFVTGLRVWP